MAASYSRVVGAKRALAGVIWHFQLSGAALDVNAAGCEVTFPSVPSEHLWRRRHTLWRPQAADTVRAGRLAGISPLGTLQRAPKALTALSSANLELGPRRERDCRGEIGPESHVLGTWRPEIVARLERALGGKRVVIAMGYRAQHAIRLTNYQARVLNSSHLSLLSLNRRCKSDAPTGAERNLNRLR